MTVSEIKRDKAHTVKIIFTDGKCENIDVDAAGEFALVKGAEISEEALVKIRERSEFLRAKSKALWLLDRADRTERQILDNLKKSGFDENASHKATDLLKSYGLLDDRRFAENFAERCKREGRSQKEIYFKLLQKGVSKNTANEVLSEGGTDESEQLKIIIEKKYKNKLQTPENISKVFAALARRGFSYGKIKEAIKCYTENADFEKDYEEF